MKSLIRTTILTAVFCAALNASAQFDTYNLPQSAPMTFNPALTGGDSAIKVGFVNQNFSQTVEDRNLATGYVTTYLKSVKGHVGVSFTKDNYSYGKSLVTSFTSISAYYAHDISLGSEGLLKVGGRLGMIHRVRDFSGSFEGDFIDPYSYKAGFVSASDLRGIGPANGFDLTLGAAYYKRGLSMGVSLDHLNRADIAFSPHYTLRLPLIFNGFASYTVGIGPNFKLSPYIRIRQQQNIGGVWQQYGLNTNYRGACLGMSIISREPTSSADLLFNGGYQGKRVGVMFGYLSLTSALTTKKEWASEVALSYKIFKAPADPEFKKASGVFFQ